MYNECIVSIIPRQRWILSIGKLKKSYDILFEAESEGRRLDEGEGFMIECVTETRFFLPAAIVQKISKTFIFPRH